MAILSSAPTPEIWFLTGSQHLYGDEAIRQVGEHSQHIVAALDADPALPLKLVYKPVLTTPDAIRSIMAEVNATPQCAGIITWMHTFSPAKMWIAGLKALHKPHLHLHTQFNRDLPWSTIDMDFMNLNQSAHGDREFGFINTRLRLNRKVVVGHWEDADVRASLGVWMRAAMAWHDWQGARFARFGDNMRFVAVTEGDKVAAEIAFGFSINGYGIGDLVARLPGEDAAEVDALIKEYADSYILADNLRPGGSHHASLREGARIEIALRTFLRDGGFKGFTTTFEDLHGLAQLPGLAVQRLMADGYGFGAEGDWKHAALLRAMKVMTGDLPGGTSFMEDYTYHLDPNGRKVLGAHMLEICPSIAAGRPSLECHPLGIGGKADPVRLVFDSNTGPAINATLVDLGNRFRVVVNEVEVVEPEKPLPKLPVARALWDPKPDFATAASAWILAGGAHHTGFSLALQAGHMEDFCEMAGVEYLRIGDGTSVTSAKNELRWNEIYYHLAPGLGRV